MYNTISIFILLPQIDVGIGLGTSLANTLLGILTKIVPDSVLQRNLQHVLKKIKTTVLNNAEEQKQKTREQDQKQTQQRQLANGAAGNSL